MIRTSEVWDIVRGKGGTFDDRSSIGILESANAVSASGRFGKTVGILSATKFSDNFFEESEEIVWFITKKLNEEVNICT